jgi:hypothetical protein
VERSNGNGQEMLRQPTDERRDLLDAFSTQVMSQAGWTQLGCRRRSRACAPRSVLASDGDTGGFDGADQPAASTPSS